MPFSGIAVKKGWSNTPKGGAEGAAVASAGLLLLQRIVLRLPKKSEVATALSRAH